MDVVTKAILETIGDAGYAVAYSVGDGQHLVEAIAEESGERFVVRGPDLYDAACELAGQVDVDLMDG